MAYDSRTEIARALQEGFGHFESLRHQQRADLRVQIIHEHHSRREPADATSLTSGAARGETDQRFEILEQLVIESPGLGANGARARRGRPWTICASYSSTRRRMLAPSLTKPSGSIEFGLTACGEYFHDRLEPRNPAEQFLRHRGRPIREHPLFGRQTLAVVEFFHQLDRQRDIADLRQHGRGLELPEPGFADGCDLTRSPGA